MTTTTTQQSNKEFVIIYDNSVFANDDKTQKLSEKFNQILNDILSKSNTTNDDNDNDAIINEFKKGIQEIVNGENKDKNISINLGVMGKFEYVVNVINIRTPQKIYVYINNSSYIDEDNINEYLNINNNANFNIFDMHKLTDNPNLKLDRNRIEKVSDQFLQYFVSMFDDILFNGFFKPMLVNMLPKEEEFVFGRKMIDIYIKDQLKSAYVDIFSHAYYFKQKDTAEKEFNQCRYFTEKFFRTNQRRPNPIIYFMEDDPGLASYADLFNDPVEKIEITVKDGEQQPIEKFWYCPIDSKNFMQVEIDQVLITDQFLKPLVNIDEDSENIVNIDDYDKDLFNNEFNDEFVPKIILVLKQVIYMSLPPFMNAILKTVTETNTTSGYENTERIETYLNTIQGILRFLVQNIIENVGLVTYMTTDPAKEEKNEKIEDYGDWIAKYRIPQLELKEKINNMKEVQNQINLKNETKFSKTRIHIASAT